MEVRGRRALRHPLPLRERVANRRRTKRIATARRPPRLGPIWLSLTARAAPALRHAQGDRARLAGRPGESGRRERGDGEEDLRFFPCRKRIEVVLAGGAGAMSARRMDEAVAKTIILTPRPRIKQGDPS